MQKISFAPILSETTAAETAFLYTVVDVIKLVLEEFWKIYISPKLKQQE